MGYCFLIVATDFVAAVQTFLRGTQKTVASARCSGSRQTALHPRDLIYANLQNQGLDLTADKGLLPRSDKTVNH